jgi:hypothetical protein
MKLYGFNGTQRSFQVETETTYIDIEDCDYTIHDHFVEIHEIDSSEPIDSDELAKEMFDYIDWAEVEKERYESHLDLDELYHRENR